MSNTPFRYAYIDSEANEAKMGVRLMAIVAEGKRGRLYISPTTEMEKIAKAAHPAWKPDLPSRGTWASNAQGRRYGFWTFGDYFTSRQLAALTTFSDLAEEARERIYADACSAGRPADGIPLCDGGKMSGAYSEAVGVYLSLAVSRSTNTINSLAVWSQGREQSVNLFSRQAIPMTWDFPEVNPFGGAAGDFGETSLSLSKTLASMLPGICHASQEQAQSQTLSKSKVVSTDPPYYDNIGYADLSDFFYVWLRQSLRTIFPDLFATVAAPKAEELVATPYRHGGKENAEGFFLDGMTLAMQKLSEQSHQAFPVTIYYAFKQSETKSALGTASTGWETFLAAVIRAGFELHGTWPIRTERPTGVKVAVNALASSLVLVCQRRPSSAINLSRTEFRRKLNHDLPKVLRELERANIAPVDVAQAAIGPGMAIYSSAKAVLNPDDTPMSVREALIEINSALDEYLSQEEGDLDAESRFALTFFESYNFFERDYGDAENLAKARNLSVARVAETGILRSVAGKVRVLKRSELGDNWDPLKDNRLCVWEATQHLIKNLEAGGEAAAASLLNQLKQVSGHGDFAANCKNLAYRLYNHCEKTKQAEEARAYNGLVIAWPELERLAASQKNETAVQASLI